MAHVHGRPDNQDEWLDDLLGRGPGDPDMHGYPGEPKQEGAENNDTTDAEPDPTDVPF